MSKPTALQPGDRVITPSGRTGEVITPPGNPTMPRHALVKLPNGDRLWLLAEILEKAQ